MRRIKKFSAVLLCGRLRGRAVVHAHCRRLSAVRSCGLFLVRPQAIVSLLNFIAQLLLLLWAGVKCKVRVCEVVKCEVRCKVIGRWLAGHLALYPMVIKLHRQRRLSQGGLLNGRQSSTSQLSSVAVVVQRIRCLLN